MRTQLEMLKEFHQKFELTVGTEPTGRLSPNDHRLRYNLMAEELGEWDDAATLGNTREVAKELADLLYVVYGTIVTHGLTEVMESVFAEVHRSNMSKVWEDGTVHRREDGKIIKPPTYSPADLSEYIDVDPKPILD